VTHEQASNGSRNWTSASRLEVYLRDRSTASDAATLPPSHCSLRPPGFAGTPSGTGTRQSRWPDDACSRWAFSEVRATRSLFNRPIRQLACAFVSRALAIAPWSK
jgi:hypothetical protein